MNRDQIRYRIDKFRLEEQEATKPQADRLQGR
ncbi:MAG: hypothetical protein CMK00_07565 [Planctomycetes bacterium]|jgi:hypothetical protein|nr:hypothetical protein [Planctomycetota bacterium]